jgi:hypothetical protein
MDGVTAIYYRIFLKCTERPDILVAGVLILHNSTNPHKAGTVAYLMGKCGWEELPYLP